MTTYMTRVFALGLSLLLTLMLVGCGGAGSGRATGNVAIMMTDAPTEDYEQILLTITAITLLPDEESDAGEIRFFDGDEVIDLLQLRNHAELFSVAEGVPVNEYAVVRLYVEQVELIDTRTTPETRDIAQLPSGKLDLIARGPLTVSEGLTLYLEIDIDAANSLVVIEDGSGELLFRPVAFLAGFTEEGEAGKDDIGQVIGEGDDSAPMLTVQGRLRGQDTQERPLLCPSSAAAQSACVPLMVAETSAFYNAEGELIDPAGLEQGTPILAMGLLQRDDSDGRRVLDVLSAVVGERPMVGTRGGNMGSAQGDGMYRLTDGRQFVLLEQAPVVSQYGERLDSEALAGASGLTLMGVVGTSPMQAALVVVGGDAEGDDNGASQVLHGDLISVDSADTLQMAVDEHVQWVRLAEGGRLVISGNGRVGEGDLLALPDDRLVRLNVVGQMGTEYFEARQIIAITMGPSERLVSGGRPEHAGRPDGVGRPDHAGSPTTR